MIRLLLGVTMFIMYAPFLLVFKALRAVYDTMEEIVYCIKVVFKGERR